MTPIPILETGRLRMRAHTKADLPARTELWADPRVVRFIGGKPLSEAESWGRILSLVGHWHLLGFGYWAVEEKSSGRFVGEIGFGDFKREMRPSIRGIPELGWVIHPEFQGRGYATEGVRAALAWGEAHFPAPHTVCIIDPGNTASIRLAEKVGYRQTAETSFKGEPILLFTR